MTTITKINSDFALLDVKAGRAALVRLFKRNPTEKVPVTITGYISGVWGNDDGISREFHVRVESVAATLPAA